MESWTFNFAVFQRRAILTRKNLKLVQYIFLLISHLTKSLKVKRRPLQVFQDHIKFNDPQYRIFFRFYHIIWVVLIGKKVHMEKFWGVFFFDIYYINNCVIERSAWNSRTVGSLPTFEDYKLMGLLSFEDNFLWMRNLYLDLLSKCQQDFTCDSAKKGKVFFTVQKVRLW